MDEGQNGGDGFVAGNVAGNQVNFDSQNLRGGGNSRNPLGFTQGVGDVVLSSDGPEKKSRKGVITLIVLVVLAVLAGGGALLWQSGVFGGGVSTLNTNQNNELHRAYNNYVNYALWGIESDGKPNLEAMITAKPYFEDLGESKVDFYLAEISAKYNILTDKYNMDEKENKVNISVLKTYFEDYVRDLKNTDVATNELPGENISDESEVEVKNLNLKIEAMSVLDQLYVELYGNPEGNGESDESDSSEVNNAQDEEANQIIDKTVNEARKAIIGGQNDE